MFSRSKFKPTKHGKGKKKNFKIEAKGVKGWYEVETPAILETEQEAKNEVDLLKKEFKGVGGDFRYKKT